MSLKVILAVHASRIERRLRPLAQTLAVFANEDGGEIWPGVRTLMQALGLEERAVRAALQALVDIGVLERNGFKRHTRRFRFNLARLASYEPTADRSGAARRDAARRREATRQTTKPARRPTRFAKRRRPFEKPCTTVQGSGAESVTETLHAGAANPAPACPQPCTVVPLTLHRGAPDLNDLMDPKEVTDSSGTGAEAPGRARQPKAASAAIGGGRNDDNSVG